MMLAFCCSPHGGFSLSVDLINCPLTFNIIAARTNILVRAGGLRSMSRDFSLWVILNPNSLELWSKW
jgi:hypothetical protein